MEQAEFFEVTEPFNHPAEHCYNVLKNKVIPNWSLDCQFGYLGKTVTWGRFYLEIAGDRDDWRGNKIQCRLKYDPPVGFDSEIGDEIKIFCRSTGPDTTLVELIGESGQYSSSSFVNSLLKLNFQDIPGYSLLARSVTPDVYMGHKKIVGTDTLRDKSFHGDILKAAMRMVFVDVLVGLRQNLSVER